MSATEDKGTPPGVEPLALAVEAMRAALVHAGAGRPAAALSALRNAQYRMAHADAVLGEIHRRHSAERYGVDVDELHGVPPAHEGTLFAALGAAEGAERGRS